MTAARLAGTRRWRIIARHVVPNIIPNIVTFSLLGLGIMIILEGALDFLGYGIPPTHAELGQHDRETASRSCRSSRSTC